MSRAGRAAHRVPSWLRHVVVVVAVNDGAIAFEVFFVVI